MRGGEARTNPDMSFSRCPACAPTPHTYLQNGTRWPGDTARRWTHRLPEHVHFVRSSGISARRKRHAGWTALSLDGTDEACSESTRQASRRRVLREVRIV